MSDKVQRKLSDRFPDAGDAAGMYELLSRELHPIAKLIVQVVNSHADSIEASEVDIDAVESDVADLLANYTALVSAIALKADKQITTKVVSTSTYTLLSEDAGLELKCTHASGCDVTVGAGVLEDGDLVTFYATQGQVTLTASGVTINRPATATGPDTREAFSAIALKCEDDSGTTFIVRGDLAV